MTARSGPIFETTVLVASPDGAALREALASIVAAQRSDAGVVDAQLFEASPDTPSGYVIQLSFDNDEAIDVFLSGRASAFEEEIEGIVGSDALISNRVLREDRSQNLPGETNCLNCGMPLRGQYCGHCGQRARSRLISLWELVRDAVGDLFELDSRLWQTIVPLLFRPGKLTRDYLEGKRARYMPPFRMYLVLSLLFFVIAFFDPQENLAILYEDETVAEETIDEAGSAGETEGEDGPKATFSVGDDFEVSVNESDSDEEDDDDCDNIDSSDIEDLPAWMQKRLTVPRLKRMCENIVGDEGASLGKAIIDNTPAALIVLLPVMAFVLQLLYPFSRRYFVEHLLFFLHFHSFLFLLISIQVLWIRATDALGLMDAIQVLPVVATGLYGPVYVFKAMRRVYGQGFLLTLLKYLILMVVYTLGFALTIAAAAAIAAFSIAA